MRPAKKYILVNTLIAVIVLLTYTVVAVARLQNDQQNRARRDLERSLSTMKELVAAKGELRRVGDTLLAGDYVINGNFEIPDKVGAIFEGAATIFLHDVRVSTNIRTSDGERATGTRLEGPAYQAVINEGRPFRGETMILGVPYLTAYDPVRDSNGRLIGILFAGVKKRTLIASLYHLKTQLYLLLLALLMAMAIPAAFITRLAAREEEGRQAQLQFLQTLMDTIPNPVFYKSIDGRYLGCNTAMEHALGMTREQLIGKTAAEIFDGEAGEIHRRMDDEVLSTGETRIYEARLTLQDGQLHDVILYKGLYPTAGGGSGGVVGTIVDLTDVRTVERALREETEARYRDMANLAEKDKMLMLQNRQAAMGQMIGNIAHQWRQPLNMLALVSQEILMTFDDGRLTREYLEAKTGKIQELIRHMSQTIEDFRRFFSPDKSKQTFGTREVVERALYLLNGELKELKVKIEVSCGEECHIEGYPNEYMQVIINIINNARDVLRERRVDDPRVNIRLFLHNGRSVVTIADNGGGIDPDSLERIFDPYFTTKSPDKGTGIGLFMARNIIESNMGGILTVRNTAEGAEFRIEV